jgi:hypothetical protein
MAAGKISSFELKGARLKSHNPPSKQNANDRTAPIRANVFMMCFVFLYDALKQPNAKASDGGGPQRPKSQTACARRHPLNCVGSM